MKRKRKKRDIQQHKQRQRQASKLSRQSFALPAYYAATSVFGSTSSPRPAALGYGARMPNSTVACQVEARRRRSRSAPQRLRPGRTGFANSAVSAHNANALELQQRSSAAALQRCSCCAKPGPMARRWATSSIPLPPTSSARPTQRCAEPSSRMSAPRPSRTRSVVQSVLRKCATAVQSTTATTTRQAGGRTAQAHARRQQHQQRQPYDGGRQGQPRR